MTEETVIKTTMYHPLEVFSELEELGVGKSMEVRDHITARGLYNFVLKAKRDGKAVSDGEAMNKDYDFKLDIKGDLGCTVKRTK